ncbi:MAG: c-type cytochrome [Deltaproteobacteria bacterium]|nr:c-type cytochrome [Deltaproteobacteria bacterium]
MKTRLVIGILATTLAVGCSTKKDAENKAPPVAGSNTPTPGSNAAGSGAAGSGSAVAEAPKPDPALMARGGYLAKMYGCNVCHVYFGEKGPDFSKVGGGGLELAEKFGTWRGPNITPHKGSGIGNWKVEDIMAAIREGVRPDGSKLYALMPYPNYHRMTDDEARAIATFVANLPEVDHAVAPNKDLKLPQIPMPKPENKPIPVDDKVKHGEYMVTLMHCNNCHAKPGKDGMPDFVGKPFSGGMEFEIAFLGEGKLVAPNITSDAETGIGKWTEADIAKSLKTMMRPDGTIIHGPMQFYQAGWAQLEDKDLEAIAAFIKSIPADKNKVAKSTFKPKGPPGPPPTGAGSASPAGPAGAGSGSAAPAK